MMLILKLPILYLVGVCWWAVRQVPDPLEGAISRSGADDGPHRWKPKPRPGRRPSRGGPHRSGARTARVRA
jgi:hypothetical protein